MIKRLKKLKFTKAPTLNNFVKRVDDMKQVKEYVAFLDTTPRISHFINYDNEGFALNENIPFFKDWEVCEEASSETVKVAKRGTTRIYFNTKEGVVVTNELNMSDECTYNDLFIFFESDLDLY